MVKGRGPRRWDGAARVVICREDTVMGKQARDILRWRRKGHGMTKGCRWPRDWSKWGPRICSGPQRGPHEGLKK